METLGLNFSGVQLLVLVNCAFLAGFSKRGNRRHFRPPHQRRTLPHHDRLGRIGKTTARAAQALGMKILAYDEIKDPSVESDTLSYCSLDRLLAESDVVVLHCPQTPTNTGMINKDTIAKMKDGVIIINNSRGPLIAEQDLADALKSGKVAGAGLDVISAEPMPAGFPLLGVPNCIITPHLSWAPLASRGRLMGTLVDNLKAFIAGKPINAVNP